MTDSTASPYDPDAALLLARIRAAGSASAEVAASTAAAAARAAEQVDRELIEVAVPGELPRVFRTGNLRLFHAASCPFRYSSRTSCGVRYPSVEWRRVLL